MNLPTWDLVITLFFLMALAYGFILGRGRIVIILIITYLAYVVSSEIGDLVYNFLSGKENAWIQSNASLFTVKSLIFTLIIVFISLKGELGALTSMAKGIRSTFLTGVYAFFNAGLIISSVIKFLPEDSQESLFAISALAFKVDNYRIWWVIIPVIVMIAEGFIRSKEESKES